MKVSYRNYPILKMLNEEVANYNWEKEVQEAFYNNCIEFNKHITVVSNSFLEAISKANEKLFKICEQEIYGAEHFKDSGVFIFYDRAFMYNVKTINKEVEFTYLVCEKDGEFNSLYSYLDKKSNMIIHKKLRLDNKDKAEDYSSFVEAQILRIIAFKKYAKVETVISKANSRKKVVGCKYVNDTDLDIEHLDSKWFTTLVKSDGFNVRGHFRLQPKKKDGRWTKELIWIDEFQKTGYSRTAKKLQ